MGQRDASIHCSVVSHADEHGDASIEVSCPPAYSGGHQRVVQIYPPEECEVLLYTPEKALELAAVLLEIAGTARGRYELPSSGECQQMERIARSLTFLRCGSFPGGLGTPVAGEAAKMD